MPGRFDPDQNRKELGFTRLKDPDEGTHAGIKYLSQLVRRVEPTVPVDERVRFALAGYNAGFARVQDARRLAGELKLDPDKWADNVEQAMKLVARPKYARRVRTGFCRCQEPEEACASDARNQRCTRPDCPTNFRLACVPDPLAPATAPRCTCGTPTAAPCAFDAARGRCTRPDCPLDPSRRCVLNGVDGNGFATCGCEAPHGGSGEQRPAVMRLSRTSGVWPT